MYAFKFDRVSTSTWKKGKARTDFQTLICWQHNVKMHENVPKMFLKFHNSLC